MGAGGHLARLGALHPPDHRIEARAVARVLEVCRPEKILAVGEDRRKMHVV